MVFRHPGREHYQRLIEAARSRLADLELDYGVEKSKVDSVRSRLFGALRPGYQERDRLRLLIQYLKGSTPSPPHSRRSWSRKSRSWWEPRRFRRRLGARRSGDGLRRG